MKNLTVTLPKIKLAGITIRTNFKNELKWETGKIFPCVQRFFHKSLADKIPNRKKPGTTFCVYTDYESDFRGGYTYFIGEEVSSFQALPKDLEKCMIDPQTYAKFTTGPGAMPNVVKEPWQKIWDMTPQDLGGKRRYSADFEVYDERASDHQNVVLDIFVGIEK